MGDSQLPEGWAKTPSGFFMRYARSAPAPWRCWFVAFDSWNTCWRITDSNPTRVEWGRPQQFLLEGVGFQDPVAAMVAANIELANRSGT